MSEFPMRRFTLRDVSSPTATAVVMVGFRVRVQRSYGQGPTATPSRNMHRLSGSVARTLSECLSLWFNLSRRRSESSTASETRRSVPIVEEHVRGEAFAVVNCRRDHRNSPVGINLALNQDRCRCCRRWRRWTPSWSTEPSAPTLTGFTSKCLPRVSPDTSAAT